MTKGKYKHYNYCRFCNSKELVPVLNLGKVPLAGGFLAEKKDFNTEKMFPLVLSFCKKCFLLQSINVINANTLFKQYFYHSSAIGTLVDHFNKIADDLGKELSKKRGALVIEIGANDGTLIKNLMRKKIKAIGVDPANNVVEPEIKKGIPIINDYFSQALAQKIVKKFGKADVIVSFNTLAHIEDMNNIAKGIKLLLKDGGYLMFETHYLGKLMEEIQYDMIYHEHQYYYSLLALQNFFLQHGMEIYDIKPVDIHHGSMRYYVQHKNLGKRKVTKRVHELKNKEIKKRFNKVESYKNLAFEIKKTKDELLKLLKSLKKDNKIIVGYGASGRGTIIMNYCGLTNNYLDYVIDDAPAKQGAYTPGNHLKITGSGIMKTENKPDYSVLFAWAFFKEIKKKNKEFTKNGGKFILPLPRVKIVG